MPEFIKDNFEELFKYFREEYAVSAGLSVREGPRDDLNQLAENKPGWNFEGDTSHIVDFADHLFKLDPTPSDRNSFIAFIGGSGSGERK